jgi:hypothetical protein
MNPRLFTLVLLVFPLIAESQTRTKAAPVPAPKPSTDAQLYRNANVGFHFQIPYGWVDRTQEMREHAAPEKAAPQIEKPDTREKPSREKGAAQGDVLLAVFERPPDAVGESVNSAVVIATESAATYHGLKKPEDYIGPLTELTASKGFNVEGDPTILTIDSRPLVRVDFTKHLTDTLTMHQATLVLLVKGQLVSFTFIASDENEVDDLIDGLHFGLAKAASHHR